MEDKIAYLIAAHSDPSHLKRLIEALNQEADFFVHIDKRSKMDLSDPVFQMPNVYLLTGNERVKVYWAGFSQVSATLKLIEKCLAVAEAAGKRYSKVVFFSGACYPIKSNAEIRRFFQQQPEVNFMRGMDVTTPDHEKYNYCLKHYHYFDMFLSNKLLTRIGRKIGFYFSYAFRKPNYYLDKDGNKLNIYHGSSWWALNQEVLEYISDYNRNEPGYATYFKYAMASDEKFFHTIFFNSPFAKSNLSHGPEAFKPSTAAFANLHIIDVSLTKWYQESDFEKIVASDKLFVRKVSTQHSKGLLDSIDRELLTSVYL